METAKKGPRNKVQPTADMIDPNATYSANAVRRITGFGAAHVYRLMKEGIVRFTPAPDPKGGIGFNAINGADLKAYVASFIKGIGLLRPRSPKAASRRQYLLAAAA
jgi:hypothetical protein